MKRHSRSRLATLALAFAACARSHAPTPVIATPGYRVSVDAVGLHVSLPDGGAILDSVASPAAGFAALEWTQRTATVVSLLGQFGFIDGTEPWQAGGALALPAGPVGIGKTATLALSGGGTLALTAVDADTLTIVLTPPASAAADRTALTFACAQSDHFLGFGEQTNALDQRGQAFGEWTMEDGIGKQAGATHVGADYSPAGNTNDSYFPMPSFLDPRGFGLSVGTTRRVLFDLCATHADAFRVAAWSGTLTLQLVFGETPRELVTRLSALTGRQPLASPWTYGVWTDAVGGMARVKTVAAELRAGQIPCSAIWTEDWAGEHSGISFNSFDWTPDATLYPNLSQEAASLHAEGYRWLAYFNTFVVKGSPEWEQGTAQGTLVQSPDGGAYLFTGSGLVPTALVDLTNPKATAWVGAAMEAALADGFDGWMADFGEWLPYDAVMADGTTGASAHNRFPVLWAQLNQEVMAQARPNGDFAYFTRSGWTGEAAATPAVWPGDQNTDWGVGDGLPSVLPMAENLGLQGIAAWGSDIGGYSVLFSPPSTKELYLRWTEVSAYSPVMRTHHGSDETQDWLFDSDAETLQIFGHYAREHLQLFPYLYTLAQLTTATGVGILLPLWLDHPDDPGALGRTDEYMLGQELLVAPVVTEGATTRLVHLPAGHWLGWETPDAYDGPTDVTVPAPLDVVPVYAPAGAILPLLPPDVQTLATATDPAVMTLAKAQGRIVARAFLGASGTFEAYDGTLLTLTSSPGAEITTLSACAPPAACAGALPSCAKGTLPCGDLDPVARQATVQVAGQDVEVTSGQGTVVRVHSPLPRSVTVQLRY